MGPLVDSKNHKKFGGDMAWSLKSPEEIVPFRSLSQILAAKLGGVFSVRPTDTAHAALVAMADHRVGFLAVLDGQRLAGVISERDYTRKLIPLGRSAQDTLVSELMTREVVTVTLAHHVRDCISLMDRHGIRHLPVVDGSRIMGVISVRDLLREAVVHHDKVLREMERERMTIFNSPA
jgi:CBS domain-containing protein